MTKHTFLSVLLWLTCSLFPAMAGNSVFRLNATTVELRHDDGRTLTMDFYGPNIVRLFMDPNGGKMRPPEATPPATILVPQPRQALGELSVREDEAHYFIQTSQMLITSDKTTGMMSFIDRRTGKTVVTQVNEDLAFTPKSTTLQLSMQPDEYFYGGGVQNGRFSHRGSVISIENTNNWMDGGVSSPTPFYWSTAGYGILWHTFRPGKYDFGFSEPNVVRLTHEEPYFDIFMMIDQGPVALLNDFYQLTGNPVLLPKFGFYEGHLNAYNRDYWKEIENSKSENRKANAMHDGKGGMLFEDGHFYKESQQPVEDGIRESLNGEQPESYQFSARAVIDRYEQANMPLGWVLPNDGYGAGYGQTGSIEGNIENLKQFGDYAHSKGVEIGLWTQSDLHPKEGVEPLLQRDIVREVRDAGVRVLKTDVAWVGAGYSFGLNGVADIGEIMPYYGNDARPFIISLDGWAGTQRYAGIWTGDQAGGDWEYIRYHLPTYIGSELSGQPNICSDMDGIFGGKNIPVNVREFQWKTFTSMQLNMDGWGSNPKYPQALGEPATSINRWYLKLKSMLMPYTYTIAHEATNGMPMIRPVWMDAASKAEVSPTSTSDAQKPTAVNYGLSDMNCGKYEFLYGPNILVAPIYQNTSADEAGNDIRDNIYLPCGQWIDFFTGKCYEGNRIINGFKAPLWKLPVFVRRGAILPAIHAHNNPNQIDLHTRGYIIYPYGHSEFTSYDDDGRSTAYLRGESTQTHITSDLDDSGRLVIDVEPTKGSYAGFVPVKTTEFIINLQERPKKVALKINGKKVRMDEAQTLQDFMENTNVFYYDAEPQLNLWSTPNTEMSSLKVVHTPRLYVCAADVDVTTTSLQVQIDGYTFDSSNTQLTHTGTLNQPTLLTDSYEDGAISPSAYTLPLKWTAVDNADYYEIEHLGQVFSTISGTEFTLENLQPDTNYEVRVRAINKDGASEWTREKLRTSPDPLRYAIHGLTAECSIPAQPGQELKHLFDFDSGTTWHTAWDKPNATPFDLTIDLHVITDIDLVQYVPRPDNGNGLFISTTISFSMDKQKWTEPVQIFDAPRGVKARYVRLHVAKSKGGFGSGNQIYIFRMPEAEMMLPGDINHDGHIDENDQTSYMNYTGLRRGDSDFDGYISRADINQNGLIDAYDISTAGIELEGGVGTTAIESVAGSLCVTADKKQVNAGDIVTLSIEGKGLRSVNAFSLALPYDATQWEYVGLQPSGTKEMRNLTNDRLHANAVNIGSADGASGHKVLYPTFVNCGEHPYLEGDAQVLTIQFKAKKKGRVDFKPQDGILVDKNLNYISL